MPTTSDVQNRRIAMHAKLIVTAATVVAAGLAALSGGPAAAGRGGGSTLNLTTRTDQFAFVDQGGPGPTVGDQLVFSDTVYRNGTEFGTSTSTCVMAKVTATTATCTQVVLFALPDGQLTLEGIAVGPNHPPKPGEEAAFTLAVTGGTGAYRTARGEADGVDLSGGEERYTIRISR
jgi:hypothetical protein